MKEVIFPLYGLRDNNYSVLIPAEYIELIESGEEGLYIAKKKWCGNRGVINRNNEIVVPFIYAQIDPFQSGISRVIFGGIGDGKFNIIDTKGRLLIKENVDNIWSWYNKEQYGSIVVEIKKIKYRIPLKIFQNKINDLDKFGQSDIDPLEYCIYDEFLQQDFTCESIRSIGEELLNNNDQGNVNDDLPF